MIVITCDRTTGEKKSVDEYEHKDDISLDEIIKIFAECISAIKIDKSA